jgi:hypothetical protein
METLKPQITFRRHSLGQFESFLNGTQTKWSICNGSLGMSGRGQNLYLVYDRTREDGKPTRIAGSLQMCKKAVTQMLSKIAPAQAAVVVYHDNEGPVSIALKP